MVKPLPTGKAQVNIPVLYEFSTVMPDVAQEIHKEVAVALSTSLRVALLELLQRKRTQQRLASDLRLKFYRGDIGSDEYTNQMNIILAHFTGFRTFMLRLVDRFNLGAVTTANGLMLAVEESLERDMDEIFRLALSAAEDAGFVVMWTDYTGLSLSPGEG